MFYERHKHIKIDSHVVCEKNQQELVYLLLDFFSN